METVNHKNIIIEIVAIAKSSFLIYLDQMCYAYFLTGQKMSWLVPRWYISRCSLKF